MTRRSPASSHGSESVRPDRVADRLGGLKEDAASLYPAAELQSHSKSQWNASKKALTRCQKNVDLTQCAPYSKKDAVSSPSPPPSSRAQRGGGDAYLRSHT